MGWYSFTSPFLANIAGGEEGVYGLLVNLLSAVFSKAVWQSWSLGCGWRRDDG
ncbi:MAG: hypothetical protein QW680_12885 [Pyrobaculum sp.]